MKYQPLSFLLLFCLIGLDVMGQATYVLQGQLMDEQNQAVPYATLSVHEGSDSSFKAGLLSDEQGRFTFESLPGGTYILKASHILYEAFTAKVSLTRDVSLGTILLSSKVATLNEIVVKGEKLLVQNDLDKITISPDKLIGSVGGTAIDILKNVPVIRVGVEGEISLQGSTDIQVLINGKASGMAAIQGAQLLSQIDASTIQTIEVVLAPSAQHSPDGGAGIINVILKKNSQRGFKGEFVGSVGNRDRFSLSPSIAYRQDNLNFFMRYNWRQQTRRSIGTREQLRSDTLVISQSTFARRREVRNNLEFGMDYYLNEQASLTLTGTYRDRNKRHVQEQNASVGDLQTFFEYRLTDNREPELNEGYGFNLSYQAESEDKSKVTQLTMDWVHSVEDERINRLDEIRGLGAQDLSYDGGFSHYIDVNDGVFFDASLEAAVGQGKLAWGGQYFYRKIGQSFELKRVQKETGELETELFQADQFDYTDHVTSVYGEYEETRASLLWGIGLRLEYSANQYVSTSLQEGFANSFFNMFPSAKIGYQILERSKVLASYSRRINRPSPNRLNPFPNLANPFELAFGNPNLKPEFIDAYSLGYSTFIGGNSLTFNLFWKQYHQLIQRVSTIDAQGLRVIAPINLDQFDNYGCNASALLVVSDQLDINIGLLFFRNDYKEASLDLQNEGFSQQYKLAASFRMAEKWESQISGLYQSRTVQPQGEQAPQYYLDLALRYQIKADKAECSVSLIDVFNSLSTRSLIQVSGLYARSTQKIDTRRLRLSIRYKL